MAIDFSTIDSTTKVISPSKLAHVVLHTQPENFAAMVGFYKTFLGAHAVYENDFLAFLTYDDEHHRIAVAAVPGTGPRDGKTSGLEHIAFTFDSLESLLVAYRQRLAHSIKPAWCVNHGVTLSIYYSDPDGNHLETQVDTAGSPAEATAYMLGEKYAENPIGVDFDPEDFIQRLSKGEDPKELAKRPDIGPRGLDTIPLL